MEKFWNRFKFYVVGLAIGSVFVYFLFGNRGCAWLPENRVKNMIGEKEILVSDSTLAAMDCNNISNVDIYNLLKNDGDVEFSKSQTRTTPKVYYLTSENEQGFYAAEFAIDEELNKSILLRIHTDNQKNCWDLESKNELHILPLPKKDVLQIITGQEFRILSKGKCQMKALNISEQEVLEFHENASIDIQKSQPRLSPNPIYVLNGTIRGNRYTISYIIGENRTRISDISGEEPTNCDEL
jgi:hypothetical protein